MDDSWCQFDDEPRRPRVEQPNPLTNRPLDLSGDLAASPDAAKQWNRPTAFKAFTPGKHLAIVRRSEWRDGKGGRPYLFLVWQESDNRRGASIVDPLFLQAATQQGRQYALRKLSLIAAASRIELPAESFQPSMLLGAVAVLDIEAKPHWSNPNETVVGVTRYYPAPEV